MDGGCEPEKWVKWDEGSFFLKKDLTNKNSPFPSLSLSPAQQQHQIAQAQSYVAKMISSLKEFPPRQEPASFSIDRVMEKLKMGMPST